jgi:hypothetical protein
MINPITNFNIEEISFTDSGSSLIFSFEKPGGAIGGYYLYTSFDGVDYTHYDTKVDAVHVQDADESTYDIDGITYYTVVLPHTMFAGTQVYCKIVSVSTTRELSIDSDILTFYTYPDKPENIHVTYDGYINSITWDELSTSTGLNSTLETYNVYSKTLTRINSWNFDDSVISSDNITSGMFIYVVDIFKRYSWYGTVNSDDTFTLSSDTIIELASGTDSEYTVIKDNLNVFISSGDPELIGTSTGNSYDDATFTKNLYYAYGVSSLGLGGLESDVVFYPIITKSVSEAYPYLRSVSNASNDILKETHWKKLKNVLVDKNYYDKRSYAIPYSKNEAYELSGYLGISECNLDIFVNGVYSSTVVTGNYGEFSFSYLFPRGLTTIKLQARDKYNIEFSKTSAIMEIRALNLYTWFYILGKQYSAITNEVALIKLDAKIENSRYATFVDAYQPFIGFSKYGNEDSTTFLNIAKACYQSFKYATYDYSLSSVLDAFCINISEMNKYEIYYNNELYQSPFTGEIFSCSNPSLPRDIYYYKVSSCLYTGEETPGTLLELDRRWWPDGYEGYNVLYWDAVEEVECYKIYRSSTSTGIVNFGLLATIPGNIFVDTGELFPDFEINPISVNFTSLATPTEIKHETKINISDLSMLKKRKSFLTIIVYAEKTNSIPAYQLDRIIYMCKKLIAPEIKYEIIYAEDDSVVRY